MGATPDQVPFGGAEFAENPEPRCPCILLLDTSGSMKGNPIAQLNEGLVAFKDEMSADSLAEKRVEVALVTFGPVQVQTDFQTADQFQPPTLETTGDTPMGAAIEQALSMLEQKKADLQSKRYFVLPTMGVSYNRWSTNRSLAERGQQSSFWRRGEIALVFCCWSRGSTNGHSKTDAVREPLKLKELRFP